MKRILWFLLLPVFAAAQPNNLSKADKVYGLSKFWQEVNYNFVYLDKVNRQQWDSTYKAMIPMVENTTNDYEYYRMLQKFCAYLKDGHTNIFMPNTKDFRVMNTMFGAYRMFIENIDGKAIIVRVNKSKKDELPVGSEIVEVNGKPTSKYIDEEVQPYISSSTTYVLRDLAMSNLLSGLEGSQFKIRVKKPNGEQVNLTLTHQTTTETDVYPETTTQLLDFKWYPGDVAYIALNSFSDPKIDSLFLLKLPELYKAKKLIVDLRGNGGGSTDIGLEILQYLTKDNKLYGSKSTTRQNISAYKAWGRSVTVKDTVNNQWAKRAFQNANDAAIYEFEYEPTGIRLDEPRIVVPTALLIGHNTASAAEDFLIYADNQKHMIKIGAPTFGSTGQPLFFELPGGGSARVCTKKDTYPDGREFVGYGVQPDIKITATYADYMSKKDPVLQKALEYLKSR